MKNILITMLCMLPSVAFAHAVPVAANPSFGEVVAAAPKEIQITFSDHVASGSPTLRLFSGTGTMTALVPVIHSDAHVITAALPPLLGGATVAWGVVSGDDGHFTEGGIGFVVGSLPPDKTNMPPPNFLVAIMFLTFVGVALRIASHFVFEKMERCRNCVRAYTLVEGSVGLLLLVSLLLNALVLPESKRWTHSENRNGENVEFVMEKDSPYMAILVEGSNTSVPHLEIENRVTHIPSMEVPLTPHGLRENKHVYTFPVALFAPNGLWHVSLTFVTPGHYDVHCAFDVDYPANLDASEGASANAGWRYVAYLFALVLVCTVVLRVYAVLRGKDVHVLSNDREVPLFHALLFAISIVILLMVSCILLMYTFAEILRG